MRSYNIKKYRISSAVSEILRYRYTHRQTEIYFNLLTIWLLELFNIKYNFIPYTFTFIILEKIYLFSIRRLDKVAKKWAVWCIKRERWEEKWKGKPLKRDGSIDVTRLIFSATLSSLFHKPILKSLIAYIEILIFPNCQFD